MTIEQMRELDATKTYKELEEAKAEIERLRKANFQLREGAEEQKQRMNSLEQAGDYLCAAAAFMGWHDKIEDWNKAKEAKP
jgi:hypothetical protein